MQLNSASRRRDDLGSRLVRRLRDDGGSATAEYAIATLAAVGFAGLLVVILRSDAVRGMLTNLIQHALSYS
jgi:Flp pilus assembly pilin Flp